MALVTIRRSPSVQTSRKTDEAERTTDNEDDAGSRICKSLNECYFANKGAALVLGATERSGCAADRLQSPARPQPQPQPDIQHHLQSMFYLLRPEETLKMAVKLESAHAGRTRYLVVVCRADEAALLGIDCNEGTTVGLVLRVLADTSIKLDGDGGFSVCVCNQQHIFKPVSVQAMWSALQTLHRASARARELNHFAGGTSHGWAAFYEGRVDSDRSCLNEWHAMDCIESRRPPSPDSLRHKPRERDETERVIRTTLKEILMSVDLDEVTSKAIRGRLEDDLDMDLAEYKSFIDQEMLTILGQMDAPTEIFDHVYLGSEWNASNLDELQRNGVRHILNVTREIDNFFPGMFDYLNIRVYDDEKTDLLKHWDNTFKYINKARNEGSKVLVHCKMGISRSASVVIAYAMKAYNWNFDRALRHVKTKRSCIKPNTNFLNQLETYQGILDAMKNKEKLQRSKSETNLKSPKTACKAESKVAQCAPPATRLGGAGGGEGGAGAAGRRARRPRSWSPDARAPPPDARAPPTSLSLENLASETRHMLMPCASGSYSVSPNQIIRLEEDAHPPHPPSVRLIVHEIETANKRPPRPAPVDLYKTLEVSVGSAADVPPKPFQVSPLRNSNHKTPHASDTDGEKFHTWDPGEYCAKLEETQLGDSDNIVKSDSGIIDTKAKTVDAFSSLVDRNLESEERSAEEERQPPSRQSSWSSFDSAVVADLSRHSSWGSHEARRAPARPDDLASISEQPATAVAAAAAAAAVVAANISDNERKFNETCAILKELAAADAAAARSTRLSASAPAGTWLRAGGGAPRRRRLAAASHPHLPAPAPAPPPAPPPAPHALSLGLVSSLKKEFEARWCAPEATGAAEDLSVRDLVDRYDGGRPRAPPDLPPPPPPPGKGRPPPFLRNSFCGAPGRSDRPPIAPNVVSMNSYPSVVMSPVMSKAQNKKQLQHGKTHPLTRLNMNRSNNRCSNPVYNTM